MIEIISMVTTFLAAHADLVLSLTALSFVPTTALTVLDQLRRRASTVPLTTSIPTAGALYFLVLVFASLALPFTAAVDGITGSLWALIALQRAFYGPPRDNAELQDAAMWVVKNAEEWSYDPAWGGPSLEAMLESIDRLETVLEGDAS